MNTIRKIIALIALTTVMIAGLSGCSFLESKNVNASEKSVAVAIVFGPHGASKLLNIRSEQLMNFTKKAIEGYGYVSVIIVDGEPTVAFGQSYDIDERYKSASKDRLKYDAERKQNELIILLKDLRADDPEVDTLESIRVAVRSFADASDDLEKVIYVADTGWSTTGLLDFSNNLLTADPDAIAEQLIAKEALPNLDGITVYWQNMGDVAAPETPLTPAQRNKLQAIWKTIIEKSGGIFVPVESNPGEGSIEEALPVVTPIEHDNETPVMFEASKITGSDQPFAEPVFLSEEQIRFKGDSDEYADPDKAMESIEPVAEYMKRYQNFCLLLIGTTAGDDNSLYAQELSTKRADAVKSSLVTLGVTESRIITKGMGSGDPWHIYGAGTTGLLAAQNRKVVLMDYDSPDAQDVINNY